ncbi:hypothetical protein ES707_09537 [subsurface metagenome]
MVYFQSYDVEAAAGATEYDAGLRSTAENPKTLLSILVQVKELPTEDSMLQVWHEKEKIAEIPLFMIDSPEASGVTEPFSFNRLNEIEVGFTIPVGAIVRVASKAVTGTQTIRGAYRYEITT